MSFCFSVSTELYRGAEALAGTRAAFERRLYYADDTARYLAAGIAWTCLVGLQWHGRWKGHFAVLANVAQVKIKLAGSCRWFGSGWWKAQGGSAGVSCDMPYLLQSRSRQLKHTCAVACFYDKPLRLRLQRVVVACNNRNNIILLIADTFSSSRYALKWTNAHMVLVAPQNVNNEKGKGKYRDVLHTCISCLLHVRLVDRHAYV